MKLFEITWNWRHLAITFSISFSRVLRRMMGLKDLGVSYNSLLGFRMIIVIDVLKWEGHWPSSKHILVMLMILFRYPLSLMILLRYLYNSLSGPEVDKLLHLAIELMNFSSKKGPQVDACILGILSNISMLICQFWAVLNDEWSTCHKFSISRQGQLLYLTALTTGSLHLLTQLISS